MKKLDFTKKQENPYKFMGAMIAPNGAFFSSIGKSSEGPGYCYVFPVMYIQLWQDPDGVVWNVPLYSDEVQEEFAHKECTFQEYIEGVINENREIQTCLTCFEFIRMCLASNNISNDDISCVMDELCDNIIKGCTGSTPELHEYFKSGVWGDLRTMANDGTLGNNWKDEYLKSDGTLKPLKH